LTSVTEARVRLEESCRAASRDMPRRAREYRKAIDCLVSEVYSMGYKLARSHPDAVPVISNDDLEKGLDGWLDFEVKEHGSPKTEPGRCVGDCVEEMIRASVTSVSLIEVFSMIVVNAIRDLVRYVYWLGFEAVEMGGDLELEPMDVHRLVMSDAFGRPGIKERFSNLTVTPRGVSIGTRTKTLSGVTKSPSAGSSSVVGHGGGFGPGEIFDPMSPNGSMNWDF